MDINTRLVKPTSFNKFCLRKLLQYIINEGYFYNISFEFRGTLGGYWRNSEPQMINNVDLISIKFRSQSTCANILLFETNLENHFVKIPVLNSQCFSLETLLFLLSFFKSNSKILSVIEINSYKNLHKKFTRATPEMWQNYELAVSLYDLNVNKLPSADWQILQNNTLQNRRSPKLQFISTNNLRCGLNVLPNCLKTITNQIDISRLTLSKETYKQKCKKGSLQHP